MAHDGATKQLYEYHDCPISLYPDYWLVGVLDASGMGKCIEQKLNEREDIKQSGDRCSMDTQDESRERLV